MNGIAVIVKFSCCTAVAMGDGKKMRWCGNVRRNMEVCMKKMALYSVALVLFACGTAFAETGGGCVRCHTDEALMKSLFVPPKIGGGEEGEG